MKLNVAVSIACATLVQAESTLQYSPEVASGHHQLYVATYDGFIHTLALDTFDQNPSKALRVTNSVRPHGEMVSWLHLRGDILYSTSRTAYPHHSDKSGAVSSWKTSKKGTLEPISTQASQSKDAVALDISPNGKTLAVPNIYGSSLTIFSHNNGWISEASCIFNYTLTQPGPGTDDSQKVANPHQAVFTPSGKHLVVPDRGSDRLYAYRTDRPQNIVQVANMSLPLGTGPRHILFHSHEGDLFMYLVSELDNSLRVYSVTEKTSGDRNKPSLQLKFINRFSTLSNDGPRTLPTNVDLASELAISKDGKFLYVSNRNTKLPVSDNIAVFRVHFKGGRRHLVFLGKNETHGKIPRHFSLSGGSKDRYIAIANQVSNNVLVVERNSKTGFLGRVVGNITFGKYDETTSIGPTAVIWSK